MLSIHQRDRSMTNSHSHTLGQRLDTRAACHLVKHYIYNHEVLVVLFVTQVESQIGCEYYFFFSSRRRHTRSKRDWSSDVCSSDLAAWAWGASRAMDYFETDSNIDEKRVAVVGHSRWGKTALWAGAKDERFAMVVSNNSGNTGAAISRGKKGETIRQINTNFPHWFTDNYKAFNDKEYDMPFDQHMLLSLIAPRLLYVSSATEVDCADPESEFLSLSCACESYHIFNAHGVHDQSVLIPVKPIVRDRVGYHLRAGEHDLLKYDWMCFLDFADGKL